MLPFDTDQTKTTERQAQSSTNTTYDDLVGIAVSAQTQEKEANATAQIKQLPAADKPQKADTKSKEESKSESDSSSDSESTPSSSETDSSHDSKSSEPEKTETPAKAAQIQISNETKVEIPTKAADTNPQQEIAKGESKKISETFSSSSDKSSSSSSSSNSKSSSNSAGERNSSVQPIIKEYSSLEHRSTDILKNYQSQPDIQKSESVQFAQTLPGITPDNIHCKFHRRASTDKKQIISYHEEELFHSTPGAEFLKSHGEHSIISNLQSKIKPSSSLIGPLSQFYTSELKSSKSRVSSAFEDSLQIISPFEGIPKDENYHIETNGTEIKKSNKTIKKFIDNNKQLGEQPWADLIIKNIDKQENPFLSPYAKHLKERGVEFEKTTQIKLLSEKVNRIEMYEPTEPKPEAFEPSPSIKFLNDPPEIDDKKNPPSIYGAFSIENKNRFVKAKIKAVQAEDLVLDKTHFVTISMKSFSIKPTPVVPILLSACLYADKKFISEEWHFTSDKNIALYKEKAKGMKISTNMKCAFELPLDCESSKPQREVYLVVVFSMPLTVDGNGPIKKYYASGNGDAAAKKNAAKTFPRNKDVLTTFAWTYAKVSDLLKNGEIKLPNAFEINQPIQATHFKDLINDANKKKLKSKYEFSINIETESKRVVYPITELEGFDPIYLAEAPPKATHPSLKLQHKLQIRLDNVCFKLPPGIKARNIFAVITMKNGLSGEPLKCIHSITEPPNLSKSVTTRCYYHEPIGKFDQIFVFDLPYPIPQDLIIHVEFFHLICKSAQTDRSPIGSSIIKVFKNAKMIEDGQHLIGIKYDKGKSPTDKVEKDNALSFQSLIWSSLVSPDSHLNAFYASNGQSIDELSSIPKELLIRDFYYIVEILINNILSNAVQSIKGLCILTNSVKDVLEQRLDEYLEIYSQIYAFRVPSKEYHKLLISGITEYHQQISSGVANHPYFGSSLYPFVFMLIIKSIYLTRDNDLNMEKIGEFLKSFSQNLTSDLTLVQTYALFINFLFDIGHYREAIESFHITVNEIVTDKTVVDELATNNIIKFTYEVLRPKFFYVSLMNSDVMINAIKVLLLHARANKYVNDSIFKAINVSTEVLPIEMQKSVAFKLLDTLKIISPFEKIAFVGVSTHPAVAYFTFILENINESEDTIRWFTTIENRDDFFESLHFLLDISSIKSTASAQVREISYAIQFALVNAMTIMINSAENMRGLTSLIYHFLWVNVVHDLYPIIVTMLTKIAEKDVSFLFEYCVPVLPKILMRLFKTCKDSESMSIFIDALIECDREVYDNTQRSMALICRAIYSLDVTEVERIQILDSTDTLREIKQLLTDYSTTLRLMSKPGIDLERYSQLIWKQVVLMKPSPDVVVEILTKLIDLNEKEGYEAEAFQTKLLIAAIVLEALTLQKRIKPIFNTIHAAKAFSRICSMVDFAEIKDDNCPSIAGMYDSPKFNLKSVFALLVQMNTSVATQMKDRLYESAFNLIDILWPLFEHYHAFFYTKRFFQLQNTTQKFLAKIPAETDRLFGKFFRIAYYGSIFGENNKQTFIFHEKLLTHLFDLSSRLIEQYKREFPNNPIELIKESGTVDESKLDPNTGYIQITFVEPYLTKHEQRRKITTYDHCHMIKTFYFDTPFTTSNKAQGTIEQQWLRRTLLEVENAMPSIFKLEKVNRIIEKKFAPIRVSYRQLRDRCAQIESAIAQSDFRNIQQLLHGSLLVMVNEGPSRMAEVFLSDDAELEGGCEKYKEKMKKTFRLFLKANEDALTMHAKHVAKNPMFIPLQNELESGFVSLKEKLEKYI
ncbi:hypothetical protein TRFO_28401 [Tritrichomonas foetus]|uniref:DOCKER domain-containing protein n=1 Tax=Tritrichomonas foetus TaxID=1144522 RepID=A0A1J4K344_9EUKA|nr:hypothetical protein TRFO_28401 [Tritrichomonas foetus]|eukprot:OHT04172.1 hypothetical protein TRFO_28401 [Tritrichomonas foetus]